MLSLHQLSLSIESKTIFNNINVSFLPGAIIHLKGKNGSGKTSLLRMLAGLQRPSSGNITFRNIVINSSNEQVINDMDHLFCTYSGHNLGININLTVIENLRFWSEVYNSIELLDASIYFFNLAPILHKKCYELSEGMRKKVAMSRLLACYSNLWLLDEIDTNLDEENRALLNNLIISKANNGGIIIFSSHNQTQIKTAYCIDIEDYKS